MNEPAYRQVPVVVETLMPRAALPGASSEGLEEATVPSSAEPGSSADWSPGCEALRGYHAAGCARGF